jgi:ubiquinone/menaquinone biosynthesis C-methylase UbiE
MLLGLPEYMFVNSPIRALSQRYLEPRLFNALHPMPRGAHILEVGSGGGHGALVLHQVYDAVKITGLEPDPRMLARAEKLAARHRLPATFVPGVMEHMPFASGAFDVVFSSGAIHHVPDWPKGLHEINRVLKPGGLLYALEFYKALLELPGFKQLAPHPPGRFSHAELLHGLTQSGFEIMGQHPLTSAAGLVVARKT